jgi:hypothetical protein
MPDFKAEIRARIAELGLPPEREGEIVEEFLQHLTDEYEAAINRGASEEEARHAIFEQLNASEFLNREIKRVERRAPANAVVAGREGMGNIFADLGQDLRFGLRTLI